MPGSERPSGSRRRLRDLHVRPITRVAWLGIFLLLHRKRDMAKAEHHGHQPLVRSIESVEPLAIEIVERPGQFTRGRRIESLTLLGR